MNFGMYDIVVDYSKTGNQMTKCPECSPRRRKSHLKTLSANVEKGVWNCHHCGYSGFAGEKKVSRTKIYKKAIKVQPKTYKKPNKSVSCELPDKVINFFNSRGISAETVKNAGVTFEKSWMPQTQREEECIVFNYFSGGELINKKYRGPKKIMKLSTGAELIFYAPSDKDVYANAEKVYITEGEPDCLAMLEIGFGATLSTPNGAPPLNTNINDVNMVFFDSLFKIAPKAKKFVLAMDTDDVGVRFRDEIARRLGKERCWYVEYPNGVKDINDVLKISIEKSKQCINNAKPYPIAGKVQVQDISNSILSLYENGFKAGLSTGWPSVDRYYTVREQEFTIVSGIPGNGKSSFLDNLIVNMARLHNWKFAIFSPENFPFERHIATLANTYVGKPFDKNYNGFMGMDELSDALYFLNEHFTFIMPDEESPTIDSVLQLGKAAIIRNGINGIIIDPWNELEHNRGKDSETDYISRTLSKVRKFCRINNVHIWIVAHPTKLQKNKDGQYPIPTPYDVSGSSHWRNKADNCICIHRDFENECTNFLSQKIRFKEVGKINASGDCDLYFDLKKNRFSESNNNSGY